jgi:hypothetical protein
MAQQVEAVAVNIKQLESDMSTIYDKPERSETFMAIMGESGIGKTELTMQACRRMKHFSEVRVLNGAHANIEDFGIPNTDSEWVEFKMSALFKPPEKPGFVMLMIDELNRVQNETISNFFMGMINERRLFGQPVPEYIQFIGTFNPSNDYYPETQDILADLAMKRRVMPVELRFDVDLFLGYAENILKFNPDLHTFLRQNHESILVPGKINCPRNWAKFNKDIMAVKNWTVEDGRELTRLSGMYMDNPTLVLWMQYFKGSLEKFVTAMEIIEKWPKVLKRIDDQLKRNKTILLATSGNDLKELLKKKEFKPTKKSLDYIKEFLLIVPKATAFTVIEDVVQNGSNNKINEFFYRDKEIMTLISSGVTK